MSESKAKVAAHLFDYVKNGKTYQTDKITTVP